MTAMRILRRPLLLELFRYGMVSAIALIVDLGCLLLLAQLLHYLLAATLSFILGGVVAYFLSVRFVFQHRKLDRVSTELSLFIALGLVGLIINAAIISLSVGHWSLSLPFAKMLAAGGTFTSNFILRKCLLFTAARTDALPST